MKRFINSILCICLIFSLTACREAPGENNGGSCAYASFFSLSDSDDGKTLLTVISPYDSSRDSLTTDGSMDRIVCMSSTAVAAFSALGAGDCVSGVSGIDYISDPYIRDHSDLICDVGYDADLNYEGIVRKQPDIVLAYSTSSVKPAYVNKLESLGIRVIVLYDYLEEHPLARTEYLKLYGALVGKSGEADSLFNVIAGNYESLAARVSASEPVPVLMNLPYAGIWYIPGRDNYMSKLLSDAGAYVPGAKEGSASSTISIERAYELSGQAKLWLNPGWCASKEEIAAVHPLIAEFPILSNGRIFNNIKRCTPMGGNDFWESGSLRPDLILNDLVQMIHPELSAPGDSLYYHIELK